MCSSASFRLQALYKLQAGGLFGMCRVRVPLKLLSSLVLPSPPNPLGMALHGADDKDIPEEYLPLPISEEYQLPSKHRRRSAQGKRTQAAQPESGSKPDNTHLTAAHWAPQTDERTPSASMDRQVSEHALAGSEGPTGDVGRRLEKGKSGSTRKHCLPQQDARDDEAAEQRPLGPVFPRKHKPAESNMHSKQAGSDQQGGKTRPPVSAYDFAAARAEAKGLDVSSIMGLPAKRKAAHNGPSARGGRSSRHAERDGAGADLSAP